MTVPPPATGFEAIEQGSGSSLAALLRTRYVWTEDELKRLEQYRLVEDWVDRTARAYNRYVDLLSVHRIRSAPKRMRMICDEFGLTAEHVKKYVFNHGYGRIIERADELRKAETFDSSQENPTSFE